MRTFKAKNIEFINENDNTKKLLVKIQVSKLEFLWKWRFYYKVKFLKNQDWKIGNIDSNFYFSLHFKGENYKMDGWDISKQINEIEGGK